MGLNALVVPCLLGLGSRAEAKLHYPGLLLGLGDLPSSREGQGWTALEQRSISEGAARKAGEILHHLRDVLKQRKEKGGPVFPVPHWSAVSAWSKSPRNRSHVPSEIRSGCNKKLGSRQKEEVSKGKALGHLLSPALTCCLKDLSVSQYLGL